MSQNRDLYKRLLNLFPAALLRNHFNAHGKMTDILEAITGNNTQASIRDFVHAHHNATRQTIYIFELSRRMQASHLTDFPFTVVKQQGTGNVFSGLSLIDVDYEVYLGNPPDTAERTFYQPMYFANSANHFIVQMTKLDISIKALYSDDRNPKLSKITNGETDTIKTLSEYLSEEFGGLAMDLNRGIKYLWEKDWIDCTKIQFRLDSATTITTMNESLTFKEQYPEEYEKIMEMPIEKSTWKYLKGDDYFCRGFMADPSKGMLSFSSFPETENQIKNVIEKVLQHN